MKAIDLDSIPYKHRFNGASLLIARANRLWGMRPPDSYREADEQKLLAALAYYDMALALTKPFDPNYSTVLNWKCNVLAALRQYEDAVAWYREIVRISDETDGKAKRNATAALAEKMIHEYAGRKNATLKALNLDKTAFDDPPYCMCAEEFCTLLCEGQFKKAHLLLSPALRETFPASRLKMEWKRMIQNASAEECGVVLVQHMTDWPDRKLDDIGWCYFSVSSTEINEAVTLVVSRMPDNSDRISQIEFGRP
jgi:tetratricopeptide (TPR) repeat protein